MVTDKKIYGMGDAEYSPAMGMCMLKSMFEAQREMSKKMGFDFSKMTEVERERRLEKLVLHMSVKGVSLLDWTNWKAWSKETTNFKGVNTQAKFEVVSIFSFLIQAALCVGMDAEEFYQYFMRKVEIDHESQEKSN